MIRNRTIKNVPYSIKHCLEKLFLPALSKTLSTNSMLLLSVGNARKSFSLTFIFLSYPQCDPAKYILDPHQFSIPLNFVSQLRTFRLVKSWLVEVETCKVDSRRKVEYTFCELIVDKALASAYYKW